jgi:hypothetical protein
MQASKAMLHLCYKCSVNNKFAKAIEAFNELNVVEQRRVGIRCEGA